MSERQNNNSNSNSSNREVSLLEKWYEQLELIKSKTGIQGSYVVITFTSLICFVYFGIMERFITNMVGTIYPVFCTIDTLEHHTGDDKQWLTYWVVFGAFTIIDMFSFSILKIIPFYFFLKIIFLVWCFMPNFQGATIIYKLVISKLFDAVEKDVEKATEEIKSEINGLINRDQRDSKLSNKVKTKEKEN